MSRCLYEPKPLTMYDPEENREAVYFFRQRQDGSGSPERITHQRAAELLCMKGDDYDKALDRFDALCRGERVELMSLYAYWLDHTSYAAVERNNAAARAEFDALCARAEEVCAAEDKTFMRSGYQEHKDGSSWKRLALSVRKLATSSILGEKYDRDDVTKAHLLSLADDFARAA